MSTWDLKVHLHSVTLPLPGPHLLIVLGPRIQAHETMSTISLETTTRNMWSYFLSHLSNPETLFERSPLFSTHKGRQTSLLVHNQLFNVHPLVSQCNVNCIEIWFYYWVFSLTRIGNNCYNACNLEGEIILIAVGPSFPHKGKPLLLCCVLCWYTRTLNQVSIISVSLVYFQFMMDVLGTWEVSIFILYIFLIIHDINLERAKYVKFNFKKFL